MPAMLPLPPPMPRTTSVTPSPLPSLPATPATQAPPSIFNFGDVSEIELTEVRLADSPPLNPAPELPVIPRQPIVGAKRPLVLAAAAAGGKLVMAVGSSAIVRAARTDALTDTLVSCSMLVGGFAAAVTAAVCFGRDVLRVACPRTAWALKAVSISAAITLAGASGLGQHVRDEDTSSLGWVPFGMGTVGYLLLCVSLPSFFSYSEQYNGPSIIRHRPEIMRALGGLGFSVGLSWATYVGTTETLPRYVAPTVLTVASTAVLLSFALASSDSLRVRHSCLPRGAST